jgi:hypothetical protein
MIFNKSPVVRSVQQLALTSTPQSWFAPRDQRSFLALQSTAAFLVGFGSVAPGISDGFTIAAGTLYNPTFPPGDEVWLWVAAGTATVQAAEG